RMPPERPPTPREFLQIVLPHRRAALTKTVDVCNAAQIVERIRRGDVRGFPYRTLRRLTVTQQTVSPVVGLHPACVERDAHGRANALAERAGRDIDEREPRGGVTFEIRIDPAKLEQLRSIEQTGFRPCGV